MRQPGRLLTIRTAIAAGAVLAALLAVPAAAAAQPFSFDFATTTQGWQVSQTNGSPPLESPTHNPGGYIEAVDGASDLGCPSSPCDLLNFLGFFSAGTFVNNYGGTFSMDLKSTIDPAYAADVALFSNSTNTYLDGVMPETPGLTFHHLSIPISETATNSLGPAWTICSPTCAPVNQAQFKAVLATVDEVVIGADVGSNNLGGETYSLDNVAFTDGPAVAVPTGRRARALKKCKKIKKKAKRRKCKKRARKLPV